MKTIWVFGWDQQYPAPDNFLAAFETWEEAREFEATIRTEYERTEIKSIYDRLI